MGQLESHTTPVPLFQQGVILLCSHAAFPVGGKWQLKNYSISSLAYYTRHSSPLSAITGSLVLNVEEALLTVHYATFYSHLFGSLIASSWINPYQELAAMVLSNTVLNSVSMEQPWGGFYLGKGKDFLEAIFTYS